MSCTPRVRRTMYACLGFAALASLIHPLAAASTPDTDTVTVRSRADVAGGVAPRLEIYVNGAKATEADIWQSNWADANYELHTTLSPGDRVDLFFPNDDVINGQDRNLHIASISVRGRTFPTTSGSFVYDRGRTYGTATDGVDIVNGSTSMWWSGALRTVFPGVTPSPSPTQMPTTTPPPAPSNYTGRMPDGSSSKIFSDSSFWYRELPISTPLDPKSRAIATRLNDIATRQFASDPWPHPDRLPTTTPAVILSRKSYTPGVFVAKNRDPIASFNWSNCTGLSDLRGGQMMIDSQLKGIHVPAAATAADGTDAEMTVYNPETGELTDVWAVEKLGPSRYNVCWGGTIRNAKASNGVFSGAYGATASGLPFIGGLVMPSELAAGEINHVIGVAMPTELINSIVSSPAQRTDGRSTSSITLSEGQFLRLPASLDVDSLRLGPISEIIARAAQRYGLLVWDGGGSLTFRAANVNSFNGNPYQQLFDDDDYVLMGDRSKGESAFPVELLQVLKRDFVRP